MNILNRRGGQANLVAYLSRNIEYPKFAIENNIQGKVYLYVIINADGSVGKVTIIKGIGGGCDQEAVRVIKSMPDWKPGIKDGKPVPVRVAIPIAFVLTDSRGDKASKQRKKLLGTF